MSGDGVVALAALVVALGGTPAEADAVMVELVGYPVPASPGEAVEQAQEALGRVRLHAAFEF